MSPISRATRYIQIGGFLSDSETAIQVFGNSMIPNYPPGCVIGVKPWNERFIEPGKVYVIETEENRFIKRLYYNNGNPVILIECKHWKQPLKSILRPHIASDRITYRDAKTYFAIFIDDNNRKPVCRLYLNSETNRQIAFIGEDKKEIKYKTN